MSGILRWMCVLVILSVTLLPQLSLEEYRIFEEEFVVYAAQYLHHSEFNSLSASAVSSYTSLHFSQLGYDDVDITKACEYFRQTYLLLEDDARAWIDIVIKKHKLKQALERVSISDAYTYQLEARIIFLETSIAMLIHKHQRVEGEYSSDFYQVIESLDDSLRVLATLSSLGQDANTTLASLDEQLDPLVVASQATASATQDNTEELEGIATLLGTQNRVLHNQTSQLSEGVSIAEGHTAQLAEIISLLQDQHTAFAEILSYLAVIAKNVKDIQESSCCKKKCECKGKKCSCKYKCNIDDDGDDEDEEREGKWWQR